MVSLSEPYILLFLFISVGFFFVFLRLCSRILDTISEGRSTKGFWKYKNDKDDYKVDYFQKLVGEKSPFSWRIGLALAMTDLEEKDRVNFLKSLETVLRQERYVIKNLKDNTKALKKIIKPFTPSKKHSEINRYGDLYKVHRIEPGSTKLETLRYVLSLSIDEFEKTNRPSKNSFSQIIRYLDQDDDPFDPRAPF